MKTIQVPTDWLREIDGMTVADAVAYLQTLPQDHTLSYWQSAGDDHGVEISSELEYKRPYTEEELAEERAERKAKKVRDLHADISYYEKAAARALDSGQPVSVVDHYAKTAERLKRKLEALTSPTEGGSNA